LPRGPLLKLKFILKVAANCTANLLLDFNPDVLCCGHVLAKRLLVYLVDCLVFCRAEVPQTVVDLNEGIDIRWKISEKQPVSPSWSWCLISIRQNILADYLWK
jgi:hypothetical protein